MRICFSKGKKGKKMKKKGKEKRGKIEEKCSSKIISL